MKQITHFFLEGQSLTLRLGCKQKIKITIIGTSCEFCLQKLHDLYKLHQFS